VREKHTDSVRGDFHVAAPGANSAPRGTEFVVSVGEDGLTTTYVVDGTVAFQDGTEASVDVPAGSKASAAKGGALVGPEPYDPEEIAGFPTLPESEGSSMGVAVVAAGVGLALLMAVVAYVLRRRRRRMLQPA
jgi:MYXO-CTERM domain-containing protein